MKPWPTLAVAATLVACAPHPTTQQPSARVPYMVPIDAVKQEMASWTEQQVRACFGSPLDSDVVAGVPRYRFQRGACTEHVMFKDGKVLSVEGYGAEQECWWVVDACEDPSASHPAAPALPITAWWTWSRADVAACFGEPKDIASIHPDAFRVERDGCTIDMNIDDRRYLSMIQWTETGKGSCRRLLHECGATRQTTQQ
jgi:hypothetical protein